MSLTDEEKKKRDRAKKKKLRDAATVEQKELDTKRRIANVRLRAELKAEKRMNDLLVQIARGRGNN